MKVVIDMNLSVDRMAALRQGGIDAVHRSTIGRQDAADGTIMARARTNEAVVLTRDLDFGMALTRQALIAPSVISEEFGPVRLPGAAGTKLACRAFAIDHPALGTTESLLCLTGLDGTFVKFRLSVPPRRDRGKGRPSAS